MTQPTDVPAAQLLPLIAAELKTRQAVKPPEWAAFVRTGVHTQQAPTQPDWWYLRSASVLREIVQQLEKSGLLEAKKTRGRHVSPEGMRLLATASRTVLKGLAEKDPALV